MRAYDVAYNPPLPDNGERKKKFKDMSLDEMAKELGKSCAKCHGDFTICEGCMGCEEGRTVITILKGDNNKLSGIMKMKEMSPVEKQEMARQLYREALKSEDPVKYLIDKCGITQERAKARLAVYRKKYSYDRRKVEVEKSLGGKLPQKKMTDIVPVEKKKTVDELVESLKEEREKLMARIRDIDSALGVIKSAVG